MLVVDDREPQEVAAHLSLELAGETEVIIDRLPAGDIWWPSESGTYGFELKSTSDMLSSMWSKENGERLEWQLENLRAFVDVPALAHHGMLVGEDKKVHITHEPTLGYGKYGKAYQAKMIAATGYSKTSVTSFLWAIQHPEDGKGVGLLSTNTKPDLLDAIAAIYRWSQKTKHKTFAHIPNRQEAGIDPNLAVLLALGIGETKADLLLKSFSGSAVAAILAGNSDLLKLKGIGPDTIKRLRKVCP